jgi:heat shock protein HtpX
VFRSYGLRTYIWNNRLKSLILLAGFPFLLFLICFAFALLISALDNPDVGQGIENAIALTPALIPLAVGAALLWFAIAWFANQLIVDTLTGARDLDRRTEPRVYNLLENLCISRGITMPKLHVVESPVLNAYASGVRKRQYTITVTRGLIDTLDDAELEAVLGHELTHIENRDVQLLVIAAVFVGIISLVGDLLVRSPRIIFSGGGGGGSSSGGSWGSSSSGSSSSSSRSKGSGGGAAILILIAIAIFLLARLLAIALRMAMSRKREYLADAGSVELTKNPDAMISALRKIEGNSALAAPSQIQAMFIDHPREAGFLGLFATHPPIEKRIAALVQYGGGREAIAVGPPATVEPQAPEPPSFGKRTEPPGTPVDSLVRPWGEPPG